MIRGRPLLTTLACCLLSFALFWCAQRLANVTMIDLMVYRAEGWAARAGADLYAMRATESRLPNTYPPFAALLFMPLTLLGVEEMRALATAGNLALLVVLVHLTLRLVGRPLWWPRPAVALALASAAVWSEPVWTTLRYGQINLLLAVLVVWDLSRRPGDAGYRWAGLGIGIAAGLKLTPALFAVLLAVAGTVRGWQRLRGRRTGRPDRTGRAGLAGRPGGTGGTGRTGFWNPLLRQALTACAAFLGTVLLAAVALPRDSRRFWTEVMFNTDRPGLVEQTSNQSLRGVLARLLHTPDPGLWWAGAAAVVAVAGLAAGAAALLAGLDAWAAVACAMTALLVSPVSWSHHWVWCIPLLVLLGSETLHRSGRRVWRAATAASALLFCSYALWWVPHTPGARAELRQNGAQMLLSAGYPLCGAAFLGLTAVVAVRALRSRAATVAGARAGAEPAAGAGAGAVTGAGAGAGRRQAVAKE
ncbi:glycosyltransferase 87 family protein [Streptomyces sp. S07_1.15]|uniref:glycosyltransferase 87 family protein n=1 Tax=Streptomyces sp. S07_1.15 TaxID=2873925 RepID=UPI001D15C005|nr:glycosyltransferase 87 family protein [Streptomyces sp. S07_1.15]MCC3654156.1 glycosyltransferase 87 family protein [Streptomyces sp. S07_1.15]